MRGYDSFHPFMLAVLVWVFCSPGETTALSPPVVQDQDPFALFAEGRFSDARSLFLGAFDSAGDDDTAADMLFQAILCSVGSGGGRELLPEIDYFLAAYPDSFFVPEIVYQRGRILLNDGDYGSAIRSFEYVFSAPGSGERRSAALYWLGECRLELGLRKQARENFAILVERWPESLKSEAAKYRLEQIWLSEEHFSVYDERLRAGITLAVEAYGKYLELRSGLECGVRSVAAGSGPAGVSAGIPAGTELQETSKWSPTNSSRDISGTLLDAKARILALIAGRMRSGNPGVRR